MILMQVEMFAAFHTRTCCKFALASIKNALVQKTYINVTMQVEFHVRYKYLVFVSTKIVIKALISAHL